MNDDDTMITKIERSGNIYENGTYIIERLIEEPIAGSQQPAAIITINASRSKIVLLNAPKNLRLTLNAGARCDLVILCADDSVQDVILNDDTDIRLVNMLNPLGKTINISTVINHLGKGSKSLMLSKAALTKSRAQIKGMINISEHAGSSNGYQKTEILMLDNESRAISIPELDIRNNAVKCSHGSSISRLDDDKLFYLQSRGMAIADSRELLIKGFFLSSLEGMPEELSDKIMLRLGNG